MQRIFPKKLEKGSNIRIIAPARSASLLSKDCFDAAVKRLEDFGFNISFGKHIFEKDNFISSSIDSRIEDLHEAFSDKDVDGILTVIGGYNSNQLLNHIDYDLIKSNPKILCGFSDITSLSTAIYAKTGVVGYYGPHFSSRGIKYGFEYNIDYFKKCCLSDNKFLLEASDVWSDDPWFINQEDRNFEKNEGHIVVQDGLAEGVSIGGHLPCLSALLGTQYAPNIDEDCILFVEQDEEFAPQIFDRQLQQLMQTPFAHFIKGILIGRFQRNGAPSLENLKYIISTKKELKKDIPVICNVNFGHTLPFATLPIGGKIKIETENKQNVKIEILEH